jgi:hypothetical protein
VRHCPVESELHTGDHVTDCRSTAAAFREHLPSEWMKKSWDRWHLLQANQKPLARFDVWTENSQYTTTAEGDYVLPADAEAVASSTVATSK